MQLLFILTFEIYFNMQNESLFEKEKVKAFLYPN